MGMIKEFKAFALKGNVMDMAVGIIIGAAFGKIVSSLVKDVVMPVVGQITGGVDFSSMKYILKDAVEASEGVAAVAEVSIGYGLFINHVIDFLIVAWIIFLLIKGMNSAKKKEEEAPSEPPKPSAEVVLLTEIRDSLKK
mgnify:CR=1 FL=1